ncbi:I78 family peptidase inhibitor [Sphingomonas panacisoli]|uniref:I78 family peptidase inhibitor n=1 Tax=Sphingomonas panacisoli TaxID=1813879 RepID=UPI001644C277|nr:I78 family peptidase inhibitor [Sphingomonas panacisoli]
MKAIALAALCLVACAPQPPLADTSDKKCTTARLDTLVGKKLTVDLIHESMKRAGVKDSRGIRPGQAVTMDYREDRLNIYTDADGIITRFTCG